MPGILKALGPPSPNIGVDFDFNEYLDTYRDGGSDSDSDDDDGDNNSHLQKMNSQCQYYDISDMPSFDEQDNSNIYTAIHVNIRSLPDKHDDQLKTMISELQDVGIHVDFIMICETFLNDTNMYTVPIDGYQFACNNRIHGRGGGVAIYIANKYPFQIRNDLKCETLFVEITNPNGANPNGDELLIGEIYRVPGTDHTIHIYSFSPPFLRNIKYMIHKILTHKIHYT